MEESSEINKIFILESATGFSAISLETSKVQGLLLLI